MNIKPDSVANLPALRRHIAKELRHGRSEAEIFGTGNDGLDAYLDGGLKRAQLHEILAENAEDIGSASGFAAMLAMRALQPGKQILWLRTLEASRRGGYFHAAGFAELGGDPARLLMGIAPDDKSLLRSAADALRCNGFGAVVIECWGRPSILDLTASRRLTLAAGKTGETALLLRQNAKEQPSTADTRWSVKAAPSRPLEANAPGHPVFDITLLRRRAGSFGKGWRVEWDRDRQCFRDPAKAPALSGAVVSDAAGGEAETGEARRLSA